jgi:hypothetical protein
MASKTITSLVDDLTGGPADRTVRLALDDRAVQIDLSDANYATLREAVAPYLEAGRRITLRAASTSGRDRSRETTAAKRASQGLREWARENGWPNLPSRGRIPNEAHAAYQAAKGAQA